MHEHSDSRCIGKEPCPKCGSTDNLARYDDGHAYCFSVGCAYYEPPSGEVTSGATRTSRHSALIDGEVPVGGLPGRKLTSETLRKFGYAIGEFKDEACQIAPVWNVEGTAEVCQKLRFAGKKFLTLGDTKDAGLFGLHLWREGGRRIVITEGEIDAMSACQAMGGTWPVVSVIGGAQGAAREIKRNLSKLSSYDAVVLMFDNDDAGKLAVEQCVPLFPPGKVFIASLPRKDASEMLQAGMSRELVNAIWEARPWKPGGLVSLRDIRDRVLQPVTHGLPWWVDGMNKSTFGRHMGECAAFGAGVGCGKTDFLMQQVAYDITVLKEKVGLFLLEQQPGGPDGTGRRLAGKIAGKLFHVPDAGWTQEEFLELWDEMERADMVRIHDHFGVQDWETIRTQMRWMYHNEGIRLFYLDHMTALSAEADDERRCLDRVMAQCGGLMKEIPVHLSFVSHLTTPDGKSHEEGGRVMAKHFTGSRALMRWAHYMFGIERNKQADDPEERLHAVVRGLKDRYTGRSEGETWHLKYDRSDGRLKETGPYKDESITDDSEHSSTSF